MITYETDELKTSSRKNTNTARKRAENIKVKKCRTAKIYTMNIERKRLMKQRREKTLQNAKGKRLAEECFLTALKASHKIHRALKNAQKSKKSDNGSINDENMNITMIADNINNLEIVANNEVNATTNAEDTDIEPMDTDNINKAETEIDKSKDIVMSDSNDDNPAMSNNYSPHATSGDDNAEDSELGEDSTEDAPSPLISGRKTNDPTKVKTSKRCRPIRVTPLELVIHMWIKIPQAKQKVMYLILPNVSI